VILGFGIERLALQRVAHETLDDQAKGAVLVMAAAFLWGTTGIIAKFTYAQTNVGPISLAWYRLLFAVPVLGILIRLRGSKVSLTHHEVALFACFGFLSLSVFETLFFTSFFYTTVQHAAALLYTAPAFVAILSWLILKERMTKGKVVAVALSILGAFLILGIVVGEPLFASRTQIGDWLGIASGLGYSTWFIFGKVLGKNRDPIVTSFLALCFGAVFLFPIMAGLEGLRIPNSVLAWQLVAIIGLVPTATAYVLYLGGLKLIEATRASVFAIIEPVSAAILGFLFLHEMFTYISFVGFALILSSILLVSFTGPSVKKRTSIGIAS
jgi:DME family drug/metabolite transporter